MAVIQGKTTKHGVPVYDQMDGLKLEFPNIRKLEHKGGNVFLRGKDMRDHLIPLEHIPEKYDQTMAMAGRCLQAGAENWDTLVELAQELRARCIEAVEERKKMGKGIPFQTMQFLDRFTPKAQNKYDAVINAVGEAEKETQPSKGKIIV